MRLCSDALNSIETVTLNVISNQRSDFRDCRFSKLLSHRLIAVLFFSFRRMLVDSYIYLPRK